MAWSPIQPKKQDNWKNSGGRCFRWQGSVKGGGGEQAKFEKARVSNIGGLYKIGELAATC